MNPIRRVTLENFQSHEFSSLDLAPGLNVIVGPSDQGKSAIIRALRWLLLNEPRGTEMMRVGGTDPCRVTLEYQDGTLVVRERSSSRNRYELRLPEQEPLVFEGFGSQVPAEIMAVTGVRPLPLDDESSLLLHLAGQLEGPFLLSETGAFRAKAIGRLNGVYVLDAALRETNADLGRKRAEEKQVSERLAEVEERLAGFADLPDLKRRLAAVEAKFEAVSQAKVQLARLQQLAVAQGQVTDGLNQVERLLAGLASLAEAEAAQARALAAGQRAAQLRRLAGQRQRAEQEFRENEALLAQLTPVTAVSLSSLERQVQRVGRLRTLALADAQAKQTLTRVEAGLAALEVAVTAEPLVAAASAAAGRLPRLRQLAQQTAEEQRLLDRMNWGLAKLQHLDRASELVEATEPLPRRLGEVGRLARSHKVLVQEAQVVAQEEARLDQEIQRQAAAYQGLLEQLGRCPTCLQPIVGLHVHDLVAATREEE